MRTAFTARLVFTPTDEIFRPILIVEDGRIAEISTRAAMPIPADTTAIDFGDAIIAPGYLDIHMHGGAGLDVMRASSSELPRLGQFLTKHGVTGYFATTVAAPIDETCAALDRLAHAIEQPPASNGAPLEAKPLGIHLEGPFLSHKRRGVHPPEYLVEPTLAIFDKFWQAARGHVRMMTIAPEIPGALEVIAEAARRKVLVSIGHSDAELPTAVQAIKAGARHATHTFNAMRPLDHRNPGILGEVLSDDTISADIIVDGIHVSPEVVKVFLQAKGPDRTVLIPDAMSAAGMPDGRYQLGPIQVDVADGRATANGSLAGSVLTMDRAVRNVTKFSNWTLREAVRSATFNPSNAAGLAMDRGKLAVGAVADFVVLSPAGDVIKTIVGGRSA